MIKVTNIFQWFRHNLDTNAPMELFFEEISSMKKKILQYTYYSPIYHKCNNDPVQSVISTSIRVKEEDQQNRETTRKKQVS